MRAPHDPAGPIGVYDSGVGGLSVLRALRERLPGESFVYVADSGNAPYGDREASFLEARAMEIADFMRECGAKALVLACNTVSVVAAPKLRSAYSFPIVAMEPAIKPAVSATKTKVILVLATRNTIASASVEKLCRTFGADVRIILQPCPGLVEQVERGAFSDEATAAMLERFLRPGLAAGADTIVFGCTHYWFLAGPIARVAGPNVKLVEPSEAIARRLAHLLGAPPMSNLAKAGAATFYTSGAVEFMRVFLSRTGETNPDVRFLPV